MSENTHTRLENRLRELRSEYQTGQNQLSILETRTEDLRTTLMRISGAIQVIEEVLEPAESHPELEEL